MGMQDITGHFALPLARPYSDVPPPYGRRRTPFVKSKRPRAAVFDLRAMRDAADAPRAAAVRAADFGSDNRSWVKPKPPRRRWRPTMLALVAGLAFGSVGIAGAHLFDAGHRARVRARPQDTVYESTITVAPRMAPTVMPVATVAALEIERPVADDAALLDALQDSRAGDASPVQASVTKAIAPRRKKAARTAAIPERPAVASDSVSTHAAAPKAAASSTESAPGTSEAVGMSAAEFSHWLASTRAPAHEAAAPSNPDALRVDLPSHTRLTDQ